MTFPAQYPGRCADCGEAISAGDQIAMTDDGPICEYCAATDDGRRPWFRSRRVPDSDEACTTCWRIHPEGACDR